MHGQRKICIDHEYMTFIKFAIMITHAEAHKFAIMTKRDCSLSTEQTEQDVVS